MKKRGEEFWAQVRRAYENGEGSYEVLAERFGVCRPHPRQVKKLAKHFGVTVDSLLKSSDGQ